MATAQDRDSEHVGYSKRAMAGDIAQMMSSLGHQAFSVTGHDRSGRVAYRMAFDFPERVSRLALMDIIPTPEAIERINAQSAYRSRIPVNDACSLHSAVRFPA
jgi:haloacetate dehalogenase